LLRLVQSIKNVKNPKPENSEGPSGGRTSWVVAFVIIVKSDFIPLN
jgi:hypothetical protein